MNIHDYATFEKEEQLIPEFRTSIKSKTGRPQLEDGGLKRKSSFKDVARQVISMESVLLKWPRRPRSRHHSSSSEDIAEDEQNRGRNRTQDDNSSVYTDTSELSDIEDLGRDLSPEEIDIHTASIAGSISLMDGSCANVNGNRTGIDEDIGTETDTSKYQLLKEESEETDTENNKKHEKGSAKHEHGSQVGKDSNTSEEKDKRQRSFIRCPCVVL